MGTQDIYNKLNGIFQDVFMDGSITVNPETTADDIEDWDSLMQMVLLSEIEKAFGMRFQAKEATSMKNVGEMVSIIESRL